MQRPFLVFLLLASFALVAGCDSSTAPTDATLNREGESTFLSPELIEQANKRGPAQVRTFDDKLADLARSVPGFGGVFFENGQLVVYMKGEKARGVLANQARNALQQALSRRFDEGELPRIAQGDLANMVIREGRYGFDELQAWRVALTGVIFDAEYSVVSLGIEEDNNVIGIGMTDLRHRRELLKLGRKLGIPVDAIRVDYEPQVIEELRSNHTDMRGGLQIRSQQAPHLTCTLGPVVKLPDVFPGVAVEGFLMNSHCTDDIFALGPISDRIYQATVGLGVHMATELVDPSPFGGSGCPSGCVYADAAFVQWNSYSTTTFNLGTVYKTSGPNNGSLVATGYFTITGEGFGYLGQEVHKVGRTTGWTSGNVTDTCETHTQEIGVRLLCQWEADYNSAGGDSGSPVFTYSGSGNNITLVGMHWGSVNNTSVYSPIAMIRAHLNSNLIIK